MKDRTMTVRRRPLIALIVGSVIAVLAIAGLGVYTYLSNRDDAGRDQTLGQVLRQICGEGRKPTPEFCKGTKPRTGTPGSAGAEGRQGSAGAAGTDGEDGDRGARGPSGQTGATGPQGPPGRTGPAGADGRDGKDGAPGRRGARGPAGPAGPAGPEGPRGTAGTAPPLSDVVAAVCARLPLNLCR